MVTIDSQPVQTGQKPLSNLQLTMLQLFSSDVSEDDLKAIQRLIAKYFADKVTALVDADFEDSGIDPESLLVEHLRTPYKPQTMA
jgi:hypothetical protein